MIPIYIQLKDPTGGASQSNVKVESTSQDVFSPGVLKQLKHVKTKVEAVDAGSSAESIRRTAEDLRSAIFRLDERIYPIKVLSI